MTFRDKNVKFAKHMNIAPEAFSTPVISVELSEDVADARGNTAAFLLALNLLSRTFERVHAVFPSGVEAGRHPWHLQSVSDVIEELDNTVDGSIEIGEPNHSHVTLSIGRRSTIRTDRNVVVYGSTWRAALDHNLRIAGDEGLGYLYAACMGAAQVLLHVLDSMNAPYKPMQPYIFSLLDLLRGSSADGEMPQSIVLPETHLVGVGAVGSAAIYALAQQRGLTGILHLIDNDKVDDSNLNRYVLMRGRDCDRWKVDVATAALNDTLVQCKPFAGTYVNYVDVNGPTVNLMLSPVDSEEGRRGLAKMLPGKVINSATGGTTITVSRHGFNDGKACLHCLYPVEMNQRSPEDIMADDLGLPPDMVRELIRSNAMVDSKLAAKIEEYRGVEAGAWASNIGIPLNSFYERAICGDAALQLPSINVVAPLSFISASAGILLAAELIKSSDSDLESWAVNNYFRVDTLHPPNSAFRRVYPQDPSGLCICRDGDYIEVYTQRYGRVGNR